MWYRICHKNIVAGIFVADERVQRAAPVLRWLVGRRWTPEFCFSLVAKGYEIQELAPGDAIVETTNKQLDLFK